MNFNQQPYIHSEDEGSLDGHKRCAYSHYDEYIQSKTLWEENAHFHVNLLPEPYVGNLGSAKIFILQLNPGFSQTEYLFESKNENFVAAKKQNIHQKYFSEDYPFLYLNPEFLAHPGGQYWLKRLKGYIKEVMKQKSMSFGEGLKYVSQRIAAIEMVPYHSKSFVGHKLLRELPSANRVKSYVRNLLQEKAAKGEISIICTRQTANWDLVAQTNNVIVYEPRLAQSGSIGLGSPACKTILKFLGLSENGICVRRSKNIDKMV